MLLNPTLAEDVGVLEHYLTSHSGTDKQTKQPYVRVSSGSADDVVYLSMPRRRQGLQITSNPGSAQREILEQVLGEARSDVVELYFQKIHPCFPILDEATFRNLWAKEPQRISSALLCQIYAITFVFWRCSASLSHLNQPDMRFAWNQAVVALRDDLLAPGMTTLHASLLAITGRPTMGVTGNIVKAGSAVTLAHSLGLHRSPMAWQVTEAEKCMRINLWWAVVIHDYWSSLAHGTPPNIQKANYNVPLPRSRTSAEDTEQQDSTSLSFIHLCSLSQILGDLLPLVYALRPNMHHAEIQRTLRRIECDLDDWKARWLVDLDLHGEDAFDAVLAVNGASNIKFCFLTLRLLVARLVYKITLRKDQPSKPEEKLYRLAQVRDTALKLARYTTDLNNENLQEFWMPYTAHVLVSATTILLRAAIESDKQSRKQCIEILLKFLARLQAAKRDAHWDIADFCLERCAQPIERLAIAFGVPRDVVNNAGARPGSNKDLVQHQANDEASGGTAAFNPDMDLLLPLDSLGYHFDLFDGAEGQWPFPV